MDNSSRRHNQDIATTIGNDVAASNVIFLNPALNQFLNPEPYILNPEP